MELEAKVDELEWSLLTANNELEDKTAEAKKSHSNNAALREMIEEKDVEIEKLREVCMDMCKQLGDATLHEIEDPTKFYRGINAILELRAQARGRRRYELSRFKELETECYLLKEKLYVVDGETGEMSDTLITDKWKTKYFKKWRTRLHAERCAYECCDDESDLDLGKYLKYLEDEYEVEEHSLLTDSDDE